MYKLSRHVKKFPFPFNFWPIFFMKMDKKLSSAGVCLWTRWEVRS